MQCAWVAPDSTRLPRPVHASDAVVIAGDESHDVVLNHGVLVCVDVVDPRDVEPDAREQALPPCDGVRAHDGVRRREFVVLVQWRASGRRHVVAAGLAGGFENRL